MVVNKATIKEIQINGDGSASGLSDLYDDAKEIIQNALDSGENFKVTWSSKKEGASAGLRRVGDKLRVSVSASMDEGVDLLDTATWEALGENDYAPSGTDAVMKKFGISFEEASHFFEFLLDGWVEFESEADDDEEIEFTNDWDAIALTLNKIYDECSERLEEQYKMVVEDMKQIDFYWKSYQEQKED